MRARFTFGLGFLLAACVSPADELAGLAAQHPVDAAVLVTGGAFLVAPNANGTYAGSAGEAFPISAVVDVLERARVFQRIALDPDAENRERTGALLRGNAKDDRLIAFFDQVREAGFDHVLVVEELQDGPIEVLGTNGRWPVTFATWILLGVGALIPDRTFESRATLRVTLRELQTGGTLHDALLAAGPIDLALTERTDLWGLLTSVVVPPFLVGDDQETVGESVRATTQRRLLLQLVRDLKSEAVRQRLRERQPAAIALVPDRTGFRVTIDTAEALTRVRLRTAVPLDPAVLAAFERELLASVVVEGDRRRHSAVLPAACVGQPVQVAAGTLRGGVASATFRPEV
ncbi:MAG: hypothetical protein JNK15_20800, partial [Planctomycetes bacterium]|nr:hypothetical protein [Planctomycetota bacterium]